MYLDPLVDYESELSKLFSWVFQRSSVKIDNLIFFLHYNVTVSFLLAATVLVTAGLYIGDPIDCIIDPSLDDVIDSYCWVHSTFTVPGKWNITFTTSMEDLIPHPGIASSSSTDNSPVKFHGYYQWVCYVLAFQAMLFYIPKCLWNKWEGNRVQMLLNQAKNFIALSLSSSEPNSINEDQENGTKLLFQYFTSKEHLGKQNFYYWKLVICEFLNLTMTLGQLYITNAFLGYGLTELRIKDIIKVFTVNDPYNRDDKIAEIFPKVTKCQFNTFGPSGSIQNNDALCVLQFNVIHEKIYLSMWIWLILLVGLSFLVIIYRVLLLVPMFRMALLKQMTIHQMIPSFNTLKIKLKIGDWFLLSQLGNNMDRLEFTKVVKRLQEKLKENSEIY